MKVIYYCPHCKQTMAGADTESYIACPTCHTYLDKTKYTEDKWEQMSNAEKAAAREDFQRGNDIAHGNSNGTGLKVIGGICSLISAFGGFFIGANYGGIVGAIFGGLMASTIGLIVFGIGEIIRLLQEISNKMR